MLADPSVLLDAPVATDPLVWMSDVRALAAERVARARCGSVQLSFQLPLDRSGP